jgi:hypothetical protein
MDTPYTSLMRDIEARFRETSGFGNRAYYKIYYCQVRPAPILTLGINPGGAPEKVKPDGRTNLDGTIAAASASFYENNEHDIIDCSWSENSGLLKVLTPLLGGDARRIRTEVVKTNLAFQRSAKKTDIDIEAAMNLSDPFLSEIIAAVQPSLVILTGVPIAEFTSRHARTSKSVANQERDSGVKQVIFEASQVTLNATGGRALVVRLAHASQFSWTYERYAVADRISRLLQA